MTSRLDEIRQRHERSLRYANTRQRGVSTALEDIGYLLGLMEEHPASEPPDNTRNVQAYSPTVGWKSAFYNCVMEKWWWGPAPFQALDVTHWRELPPIPQGYAPGADDE